MRHRTLYAVTYTRRGSQVNVEYVADNVRQVLDRLDEFDAEDATVTSLSTVNVLD